jgi:hypothetical protein
VAKKGEEGEIENEHDNDNDNEGGEAELPGETGKGFLILAGGFFDDLRRESGRGRGLIPLKRLEVVAHKLLVEAEWAGTDLVRVGRPKP